MRYAGGVLELEPEKKPKTPIRVRAKRPKGRVPGVLVPASPAQIAANRVQNWKHGRYAQTATLIEARARDLSERDPELVPLTEGYLDALETGSLDAPNAVAALSLAEQESRRRRVADRITKDGETLEELLFDKDGNEIGRRLRAHPLLEVEKGLVQNLGHTASEMQLTRKSSGEGRKDAAMAALLRRDALLRGMPKDALPPPADEAG